MFKKILTITAVSLGLLVTGAFAQQPAPAKKRTAELDIFIRDFPYNAPGFQFVTGEGDGCDKGQHGGGNGVASVLNANSRSTTGMLQPFLRYDKTGCNLEDIMGAEGDPDHIRYRYCAYPQKGSGACKSDYIEAWFDDNKEFAPGQYAKAIRDVMYLEENTTSKLFEIVHTDEPNVNGTPPVSYNWNGNGDDNGYFPLDKFTTGVGYDPYGRSPDDLMAMGNGKVYGLQNCSEGGSGGWTQVGQDYGPSCRGQYNHNYGFSMTGSGTFKYTGAADVFNFVGDDDMWIFIDGELAVDIGGVHQAVAGGVTMTTIAAQRGWEVGSMHSVNFFYLDRQTTGSNMVLKMSLTDLSPPRFGSPRILQAKTVISQDEGAIGTTTIYVNSDLSIASMQQHIGTGTFPIIVHKSNSKNILGYRLESFKAAGQDGSNGYIYVMTGVVCSDPTCTTTQSLNSGDSLSFNVLSGDIEDFADPGFALENTNLYIKSNSNIPSNKLNWARNSTTIPPLVTKPEPGDPNPLKPDFDMDSWFSGNGPVGPSLPPSPSIPPNLPAIPGHAKNNDGKVSGFGNKGTAVPANKAGELQLTVYPNAGYKGGKPADEKLFGLPPRAKDGNPYGIADPSNKEDGSGGYMFVKNGFSNESSVGAVQVAPTRCTRQTDNAEEPQINCLNFSTLVKQPFKMAVTVYDQLGNFVTQYREEVTKDEFRRVVQAPGFFPDYGTSEENPPVNYTDSCAAPDITKTEGPGSFGHPNTLTTNGLVKASVNIYPFSADGRRFGNGVYLLKVDRVDMPYDGCMNIGGEAVNSSSYFVRLHSDEKFGYMRSKPKK